MHCEAILSDAAQLFPTSALTGNYLFLGKSGTPIGGTLNSDAPGAFTLTATQDATHVFVHLAGALAAGAGVPAAAANTTIELDLYAGDVIELLGQPSSAAEVPHADLSGSILNADKPIQVLSSVPITAVPSPAPPSDCCGDHLEEALPPAEALGTKYLVLPPSTAKGSAFGHYVRLIGMQPTSLTYENAPSGAPAQLQTGQVVEFEAKAAFSVAGTAAFGVVSLLEAGTLQNGCANDPSCYVGDPSMSFIVPNEQFLSRYAFATSGEFPTNYADVVAPMGTTVTLDGSALAATPESVVNGWVAYRVNLGAAAGLHTLAATQPFGVQLLGFAYATSYYAPGGQSAKLLGEPPVVTH